MSSSRPPVDKISVESEIKPSEGPGEGTVDPGGEIKPAFLNKAPQKCHLCKQPAYYFFQDFPLCKGHATDVGLALAYGHVPAWLKRDGQPG